jgi:hypothetical protein
MVKRRRPILTLTGEQAHQAFALLVDEGKLAVGEVWKALGRRDRLIRALRARLAALEEGTEKVGKRVLKGSPPMARKASPPKRKVARRKPRMSAATRKLYQQQGRYMAALRPLSKEQRGKIKVIREKSGVQAAIAAAKGMAK